MAGEFRVQRQGRAPRSTANNNEYQCRAAGWARKNPGTVSGPEGVGGIGEFKFPESTDLGPHVKSHRQVRICSGVLLPCGAPLRNSLLTPMTADFPTQGVRLPPQTASHTILANYD